MLLKPGLSTQEREEILSLLEERGYNTCTRHLRLDEEGIFRVWPNLPKQHLPGLVAYFSEAQTEAVLVTGEGCVEYCFQLRNMIRARHNLSHPRTLIHASDNPAKAAREISAFFNPP